MSLLLGTDYDNTFRIAGKISDENIEAVKEWRKRGNLFGIVTGRFEPPDDIFKFDFDFIMCCSGGLLYNNAGEIEYSVTGSNETLVNLARGCMKYSDGDDIFKVRACDGIYEFEYDEIRESNFENIRELGVFNQASIYFDDLERATAVVEKLQQEVTGVSVLQNGTSIDIPPAGMNKAEGLRRYAALHNVKPCDVYTTGDNMNDYEMLSVWNGYVVEHGRPVLIEKIGRTTPSVAALIEKVLSEK